MTGFIFSGKADPHAEMQVSSADKDSVRSKKAPELLPQQTNSPWQAVFTGPLSEPVNVREAIGGIENHMAQAYCHYFWVHIMDQAKYLGYF